MRAPRGACCAHVCVCVCAQLLAAVAVFERDIMMLPLPHGRARRFQPLKRCVCV